MSNPGKIIVTINVTTVQIVDTIKKTIMLPAQKPNENLNPSRHVISFFDLIFLTVITPSVFDNSTKLTNMSLHRG